MLALIASCSVWAQFSTETRNIVNAPFNDYSVEFRPREGLTDPDSAVGMINNGKYSVINKSTRDYWCVTDAKFNHGADYEISVDAIHRSGVTGFGYGLFWGTNNGNTKYLFLINAKGSYSFWKKSGYSTKLENPIKWKDNSAIKGGDNNVDRLTVKMSNSYWHFYVNDVLLDSSYADQYFTGDDIGVSVGNKQQVDFDNLTLKQTGYKKVSQTGTLCSLFPFFEKTGKVKHEPITSDEKYPEYGSYAYKSTVKVTDAVATYVSSTYFYAIMGVYQDAGEAQAKMDAVMNSLKKCLPNYYFRKKQKGFEPPYYYIHEKSGTGFKEYKSYLYTSYADGKYTVGFCAYPYTTENIITPISGAADKTSTLGKQVWQGLDACKNNFSDLKGDAKESTDYSLTTYYNTKLDLEGTTEGEIYTLMFTSMEYNIGKDLSRSLAETVLNDWRDKLKKILGSDYMMMSAESYSNGKLDTKEYKFYTKDMDKYPIQIKMTKNYSNDAQYSIRIQFNGNDWF